MGIPHIAQSALAFCKKHWKKPAVLLGSLALGVTTWVGASFESEIKAYLDLQRAHLEISTSTTKVELNKKIQIEARVDSIGLSDLSPGTLYLEADADFISIKPKNNVKIGSISGSQPIDDLPELTVIKMPTGQLKISANYISGELKVKSNDIFIEVVHPVKVIHPHFDISDTGRVNLSGEWIIEVGGIPGTMTLHQRTDNQVSGTYKIPDGKWSAGEISGQKDGKTFRVRFNVPGQEKETIRVAGYFEIQSENGDFIEIKGCAYHLRKSATTYNKTGMEGVDCNKAVYYDYWEVLQTANFYAFSPFDKQIH